jgi:DNA-binding NarL/FixJ family response regulator
LGVAELEIAVRAVARGETYLSPAVSKHVIADYLRRTGGPPSGTGPLTRRQREILRLVAGGRRPRRSPAGWASASRRSRRTGPN